jgi:NADH-quinone oxidoreductase subunit M
MGAGGGELMSSLFNLDSFALVSIAVYTLLWVIAVAAAPRRDLLKGGLANLAIGLIGTWIAYASGSIWMFVAGWFISIVPTLRKDSNVGLIPKLALVVSTGTLALGAAMVSASGSETPAGGTMHRVAFGAFVIAALLRKGMFPAHVWVVSAFDTGSLPGLGLLLNSHLGPYLLIRFAMPMLPINANEAMTWIGLLSLLTAVFTAVRALTEHKPRRILALLCVSQASFILAGLENRNVEGITGALVHWWVVAFATTGMIAVYRALEARSTEVESPRGFLGFAVPAPRLAVFFAICGLAVVGLPGTLGFTAEDLLFHGSLETHPWLGIALPLATALNAITVLRLFATLFLGRPVSHATPIPDARPAERWALTASVVFLVLGGIAPSLMIAMRSSAAATLASLLSSGL